MSISVLRDSSFGWLNVYLQSVSLQTQSIASKEPPAKSASNFCSFLLPSRQISLAFVNGFRQSKSLIFSLIFKEYIFGMQIDFYSGVEVQLFLNLFSPSISLSSILAS